MGEHTFQVILDLLSQHPLLEPCKNSIYYWQAHFNEILSCLSLSNPLLKITFVAFANTRSSALSSRVEAGDVPAAAIPFDTQNVAQSWHCCSATKTSLRLSAQSTQLRERVIHWTGHWGNIRPLIGIRDRRHVYITMIAVWDCCKKAIHQKFVLIPLAGHCDDHQHWPSSVTWP